MRRLARILARRGLEPSAKERRPVPPEAYHDLDHDLTGRATECIVDACAIVSIMARRGQRRRPTRRRFAGAAAAWTSALAAWEAIIVLSRPTSSIAVFRSGGRRRRMARGPRHRAARIRHRRAKGSGATRSPSPRNMASENARSAISIASITPTPRRPITPILTLGSPSAGDRCRNRCPFDPSHDPMSGRAALVRGGAAFRSRAVNLGGSGRGIRNCAAGALPWTGAAANPQPLEHEGLLDAAGRKPDGRVSRRDHRL